MKWRQRAAPKQKLARVRTLAWRPSPIDLAYAELVADADPGFQLFVVPDRALRNPYARGAAWSSGHRGQA